MSLAFLLRFPGGVSLLYPYIYRFGSDYTAELSAASGFGCFDPLALASWLYPAEEIDMTGAESTASSASVVDESISVGERAALYLGDGLHFRETVDWNQERARSKYIFQFLNSRLWGTMYTIALVTNLSLAWIEPPCSTCDLDYVQWNFYWEEVPLWLSPVIEVVCWLIYGTDLALTGLYQHRKNFLKNKWNVVRAMALSAMVLGAGFHWIGKGRLGFPRFHRLVRPLLAVERFRNVRKIFGSIVRSIPGILSVILLLVFGLIFFGLFFHVAFAGVTGQDGECNFFKRT